ncbi:MAG: hypothetical protein OXF72_11295 [Gammaproteobacteria bacterium]|nr:hypothetical protein [Gammaproteobacteria bacterium]MCY4198469.1 hypothetical protein [Gammaproteobacteria bacterium]MCY4277839.1 hypothetical protein [Gammaproteobacteria bacterium]MCY4323666.1 hypothetical protein [Gammaproteobacteria bacterium]
MRIVRHIKQLLGQEARGRVVFRTGDLRKLFDIPAQQISRVISLLVEERVLVRATKGVYVNILRPAALGHIDEHIARAMRRGEHNYVSLESALSEYGMISQIPLRLTVMTTGRRGVYGTPFGTIEFVHTARSIPDILASTIDAGRPLPFASKEAACRDLRRVGRNVELLEAVDEAPFE